MATTRFGPGTVTLGSAPLDISCQVLSGGIVNSHSESDPVQVLGDCEIPGQVTTVTNLELSILADPVEDGVTAWSWANHGTEQAFEYTPNIADGATFTGTVLITRLDFRADERGGLLTSDAAWRCVGNPVPTFASAAS